MKFSELKYMFHMYDTAMWSPTRMAVHFGCDCGCGGDEYTQKSWDEEEAHAKEAIYTMKEWCYNNGIEWDGEE